MVGDKQWIPQDRGLDTAYARCCFYPLLGKWAAQYGVESALEGPLDGTAGVRGVHCVGLARAGVRVVAAVADEASAEVARAVYEGAAPGRIVDVRVGDSARLAELPVSDLVLVYQGLLFADDWRSYLRAMAKLARTVLVVATPNPENWGLVAIHALRRARTPEGWRTDALAPLLWEIGRVREHVYFDAPWWPARPPASGPVRSSKYVYGAERWPYFGGAGWADELEPALRRHPAFEESRAAVLRRAAHLHAFVVDLRPRTPRARRTLAQARVGS
jgi:hypothetical protein